MEMFGDWFHSAAIREGSSLVMSDRDTPGGYDVECHY